ncbi:MAG: class I SAM-dependent methyltransferase [Planctomycetaceae bacterium]
MTIAADLKTLWQLALAPVSGETPAERLESFYRPQAAGYDDFRRRLLSGREELIMRVASGRGVWVDLGAGTGANLEMAGPRVGEFERIYAVDLTRSLLDVARRRVERHGWHNVEIVQADAKTFAPPGPVDLVTFSYSLTMIDDWFRAVDRACEMLRPGGQIGVVDFFVARKHPAPGRARHSWQTRHLWPAWFARDNVFLSADHIPYLQGQFETQLLAERLGKIPYLPFVRAPYYLFLGRRK